MTPEGAGDNVSAVNTTPTSAEAAARRSQNSVLRQSTIALGERGDGEREEAGDGDGHVDVDDANHLAELVDAGVRTGVRG